MHLFAQLVWRTSQSMYSPIQAGITNCVNVRKVCGMKERVFGLSGTYASGSQAKRAIQSNKVAEERDSSRANECE